MKAKNLTQVYPKPKRTVLSTRLWACLVVFFTLLSSSSQAQIVWDDSSSCGSQGVEIFWVNPTCIGDNDGVVAVVLDTSVLSPPFEVTIRNGINQLFPPQIINASGIDTFFNISNADNLELEHSNGVLISCPSFTLPNFVENPPEIDPQVTFSNQIRCFGLTVDSIIATNTNGIPPFQYTWGAGASTGFSPQNGSGDSVIINVPADTFRILIQDADGCVDSLLVPVVQPDTLIATANVTNIQCRGNNDGTIALNVNGGTRFTVGNTYSYNWSPALPNDSVQTGLSAQVYNVTVSDSLGCLDSALNITITEPAQDLSITIIDTENVACKDESTGKIVASFSGGTPQTPPNPYQIFWSPNVSTTDSALNLPDGVYDLRIQDANGCEDSTSVTITEPADSLEISLTSRRDLPCRNQPIGELGWTITGGTPNYTIDWSHDTAASALFLNTLLAGTYTVTATDANGCTNVNAATLTQPATGIDLTVIDSGDVTTCFGDTSGYATVRVQNGVPPYVVTWPYGTVSNVAVSGGTASDSLRGGVNQVISVEDDSGCVVTTTVTITEPAPIGLAFDSSSTQCIGDSTGTAEVFATGGPTPGFYFYQWNDPANSTISAISGLASGFYAVTVSDTTGNCLPSIDSVFVPEPASPLTVDTVFTTQASCFNVADASAQVRVTGGTPPYSSITWSAGVAPTLGNDSVRLNLPLGINFAVVSDATGCSDSIVFEITQPDQLQTSIDTIQQVSCNNGDDGILEVSGINGTTPYAFSWQRIDAPITGQEIYNADSSQFSSLEPGTYVALIVDANGCFDRDTAILDNPTPIVVNFPSTTTVSCFGFSDGEATVAASGGRIGSNFNFSWENGQTGSNLSNVSAGFYAVTVTDQLGRCPTIDSVQVIQNSQIAVNFRVDSLPDCDSANGGLTAINPNGGVPFTVGAPYTFSWVGQGVTTATLSGVPQGIYQVDVTDSLGCTNRLDTALSNINAPQVTSAIIQNPTCNGSSDGSIDLSITGVQPITVLWNTGQTNEDISGLDSGRYTIQIEDFLGCIRNESYNLDDPDPIQIDFNVSNISCSGLSDGAIGALVSGGIGPFSYSWSNGVVVGQDSVNQLPQSRVYVTVTDNGAAVGCQAVDSAEVLDPAPLQIQVLDSANNNCAQDTQAVFRIYPNGGTGTLNTVITPTPVIQFPQFDSINVRTVAGTYTINTTDANDCLVSRDITLTDPPILQFNGSPITTPANCPGDSSGSISVQAFGGTGALTYSWSPILGNVTGASNLPDGVYVVTVTDANNCSIETRDTITSLPAVSIGLVSQQNVSCFGGDNGRIQISIAGGSGNYNTPVWNPSGTVLFPGTINSNLDSGIYEVSVTDNNGCDASRTFTITEPAAPVSASFSATQPPSCAGDSLGSFATVRPTGGTAPYAYNWSGGVFLNDTTQENIPAGEFGVTLTDANRCEFILVDTLSEAPNLVVELDTVLPTCLQSNGALIVDTIFGSGGIPYTIEWYDFELNFITSGDTLNSIFAGLYYLVVTANGCAEDTIPIVINNPSTVTISLDSLVNPICFADSNGFIQVSTSQPVLADGWSRVLVGSTDSLTTGNLLQNVPEGTYIYQALDPAGCIISETYQLNDPDSIVIAFNDSPISCAGLTDGSIEAIISGGNQPYSSFTWNGPSGTLTGTDSIGGLQSGSYSLAVVDSLGCSSSNNLTLLNPDSLRLNTDTLADVRCFGDQNGQFSVEASGGRQPYSFSAPTITGAVVFPTDSTLGYTNLGGNSFFVYVTDSSGCQDSVFIEIEEPTDLVASIDSQAAVSCFGSQDGYARVQASGGTPGYQYLWNTGSAPFTSNQSFDLSGGITNVTVQDLAGCQEVVPFFVREANSPLQVSATVVNDVSCPGGADGAANASISGGIQLASGGYNIEWIDTAGIVVSTVASANGLFASTYVVRVSDSTSCVVTDTVNLLQPAPFSFSFTIDSIPDCGDTNGVASVVIGGATASTVAPFYGINWLNSQFQSLGKSGTTAQNLGSGLYALEVIDALGCTDTLTFVAVPDSGGPVVSTASKTNPSCFGFSDGELSVSATGKSPFTYNWIGQTSTDSILTAIGAGVYTVEVIDADTCRSFYADTLVNPPLLSIDSFQVTDLSCFESNDGTASVFVTGGSGNYTYNWSSGVTSITAANLEAGFAVVNVQDAQSTGCTLTDSVEIIQPTAVSLSTVVNTNANCGQNDGLLVAGVSGGNGTPYTIQWYSAAGVLLATNDSLTNRGVGSYFAVATDAQSCSSDTLFQSISENGAPVITAINAANVRCFGEANGAISVVASGSNLGYTWSNGGNSASVSGLIAGTYFVTVSDTVNGCATVGVETITQPAQLSVSATISDASCPGENSGSILLNASGGVAPYDYLWSLSSIGNNSAASNLPAGNYQVTTSDDNACTLLDTFTVQQPQPFSASFAVTEPNCGATDGSIVASGLGGGTGTLGSLTYRWLDQNFNGVGVPQSLTLSAIGVGAYYFELTDSVGCTDSILVGVSNIGAPALTVDSIVAPSCNANCDGAIFLDTSNIANLTFAWSNGATTPFITNQCPGIYFVQITDQSGSPACTQVLIDTIPLGNAIQSSVQLLRRPRCVGDSNAVANVSIANAIGNYSFAWSSGEFTQQANNLSSGTNYVTIANAGGTCSIVDSIFIPEAPEIRLDSVNVIEPSCALTNGAATAFVSGGNGLLDYLWSTGANTQTISNLSAGTYNLSITDDSLCQADFIVNVSNQGNGVVISKYRQPTACVGSCDGEAAVTLIAGSIPYTVSWFNNATQQFIALGDTVTGLCSGNYEVEVNSGGCILRDSIRIEQPTPIQVNFVATDPNCGTANGSLIAQVSGGNAPYSYQWLDNNFGLIIPQPVNDTAANLASGIYNLQVTDANGCQELVQTVLSDSGAPVITINQLVNPSCSGVANGSIDIELVGGFGNPSYTWSPGGFTTQDISNLQAGTYTVQVIDGANCSGVQSFTLTNLYQLNANLNVITDPTCPGVNNGQAFATPLNGNAPYSFAWSSGEANDTAFSLGEGANYITVTDANGCALSDSLTLSPATPITIDSIVTTPPSCAFNTGTIAVFVSGGNQFYNFNWSSGANGANLINVGGGIYTVTIDDGAGCAEQFTIPLSDTITGAPFISTTSTPASCFGACDGSVNVAVSGTGSYTFNWPSIPSTQTLVNDLCAGIYGVEVFEQGSGCVYADTVSITEPQDFQVSFSLTLPNCNQAAGSIAATVNGGNPPYTLIWLTQDTLPLVPFQSGANLNNVGAGIYLLNVSDGNGCSSYYQVILNNQGAPAASLNQLANASCSGICNGAIDISTSAAAPTYQWSNGDTSQDISNLCAGTYILTLTDAGGCIGFYSYTINDSVSLSAQIQQTGNPLCSYTADASAFVVASGGSTPYTYLWSSGEISDTAIALTAGLNSVTIFDTDGCNISRNFQLAGPQEISISSLLTNEPNCGTCNGSIAFAADGGTGSLNYAWNNGSTSTSEINLCGGSYLITITDSVGCSEDFIIPLSTTQGPTVQAAVTDVACFDDCNGEIALSVVGSAPSQVFWPQLNSSDDTLTGLCAGTYVFEVTDSAACVTADTVSILEPNEITAIFSSVEPACGTSTGIINAVAFGGTPASSGYLYNWLDSAGVPIMQNNASATGLTAGFYELEVTDSLGCNSVIRTSLSNSDGPTVNLNRLQHLSCIGVCDGAIDIDVFGSAPFVYAWSDGSNSQDVSNLCADEYELIVADTGNCLTLRTYEIIGQPGFNAFVSSTQNATCEESNDGSITLFNQGSSTFQYNWEGDDGYTSPTQNVINLFAGTYRVTVTDANGCIVEDSATLRAQTILNLSSFGDTVICDGLDIRVMGVIPTGEFTGLSISWIDNVGNQISTTRNAAVIPREGFNRYVATALSGGCFARDTVDIIVNQIDSLNAGANREIAVTDEVVLGGNPTSNEPLTYSWQPAELLDDPTSANPTFRATETTAFILTAVDGDGCERTDTVTIVVIDEITINNGFSPNGDGVNDFWALEFLQEYPQAKVEVYNRWGIQVYESVGYANPWDGNFDGTQLPVGTYYYIIELNDDTTEFNRYTGSVTIIR